MIRVVEMHIYECRKVRTTPIWILGANHWFRQVLDMVEELLTKRLNESVVEGDSGVLRLLNGAIRLCTNWLVNCGKRRLNACIWSSGEFLSIVWITVRMYKNVTGACFFIRNNKVTDFTVTSNAATRSSGGGAHNQMCYSPLLLLKAYNCDSYIFARWELLPVSRSACVGARCMEGCIVFENFL